MIATIHRIIWLLLLCTLSACLSGETDSPYYTVTAEVGDVRDIVPASGVLIDEQAAEIRAPKAGVIKTVLVKEGDVVVAGQVLATLSAPSRGPAREVSLADAASNDGAIREARLKLNAAEAVLSRRQTLLASGFISAAAVEDSKMNVALAASALENAIAERRTAEARARLAVVEASESDIVAPLAGVVTMVGARVGQRAAPDDARPLFQTTMGGEKLSLEFLIPEPDMSRVSEESRVSFTVDAYPGIRNEATMVSIGRAPIREGRYISYRGVATYDNLGGKMLPGMTASVELIRANSIRVLRVPARAIYFQPPNYMPPIDQEKLDELMKEFHGDMRLVRAGAGGGEFGRLLGEGKRLIFVLEDGRPVRREVRIGAETDEYIEITDGIRPGEIVILDDAKGQGPSS